MDIVERLLRLRRRERLCTVDLLEALLECDRTRAYLDHGYESLWTFLVGGLRYSKAGASRRSQALRCARKFPVVITWVREDRVTLSSLEAIAPLIDTFESEQALLDRIDGKSQTEVQRIVAQERPVPERKERVKREFVVVDVPAPTALFGAESGEDRGEPEAAASAASGGTPAAWSAPTFAPTPPPQPQERVHVTLSLTPEEFALIERARAIASRRPGRVPSVHEVLVESVKTYLDRKAPKVRVEKKSAKRDGQSNKEKAASRHSRHIPAATRDAVFLRDGERCTFVAANGRQCDATHDLQVDHIRPHALGGSNELENLRVLCGAHNRRRVGSGFGMRRKQAVPHRNSERSETGSHDELPRTQGFALGLRPTGRAAVPGCAAGAGAPHGAARDSVDGAGG